MENVIMKKEKLLEILRKNLAMHQEMYKDAADKFRDKVYD